MQEQLQFIRDRITRFRLRDEKLSEAAMSRELGKNKNYIEDITSGRTKPSLTGLLEIINYLGVTPEVFFSENIERKQHMEMFADYLVRLDEDDLWILVQNARHLSNKNRRDG